MQRCCQVSQHPMNCHESWLTPRMMKESRHCELPVLAPEPHTDLEPPAVIAIAASHPLLAMTASAAIHRRKKRVHGLPHYVRNDRRFMERSGCDAAIAMTGVDCRAAPVAIC